MQEQAVDAKAVARDSKLVQSTDGFARLLASAELAEIDVVVTVVEEVATAVVVMRVISVTMVELVVLEVLVAVFSVVVVVEVVIDDVTGATGYLLEQKLRAGAKFESGRNKTYGSCSQTRGIVVMHIAKALNEREAIARIARRRAMLNKECCWWSSSTRLFKPFMLLPQAILMG